MRTLLSFVPPLAAAALATAAAVNSAAAQRTARSDRDRPVIQPAALTARVDVRPLATYRFVSTRDQGVPMEVTVADSAGMLVGSYRLAGERSVRPMLVELLGADLILQGDTPSGALTMRLNGQNDPDATGPIVGRWWLGNVDGVLRGRFTR